MNIINQQLRQRIMREIITPLLNGDFKTLLDQSPAIIDSLIENIPPQRRNSYGRVYAIKSLGHHLFCELSKQRVGVLGVASALFAQSEEPRSKGVWLGVLSFCGLEKLQPILPFFKGAAASKDWEIREFAQMFFRKLIKKHPDATQRFLLTLVESENPQIRRFVAETLRPVQENQWFYQKPEFSLRVLRQLFTEKVAYPRTSVGNNLSDLARRLPDLVYNLVHELVERGDENSYWIAYRACRNLVKKDPVKVMRLLRVEVYRYKSQMYTLNDYE